MKMENLLSTGGTSLEGHSNPLFELSFCNFCSDLSISFNFD